MADWLDVSSTTPRIAYTATAGQTAFAVPFEFFAQSYLKVYRNGILLVLATHYTIAGPADYPSGTVTLLVASTVGDKVSILSDIPVEQQTHVPPSGPLDIPAINFEFSRHVGIMKQFGSRLARALQLPDGVAGELDIAAPVAGEFLKWNATGDGIDSTTIITPDGSYAIATQSEALAGTSNALLMTPLRTAQVISDSAPGILAWDNGVPGDASDQTAALQAIIDGLPVEGGEVLLRGDVYYTQVSAANRRNIRFTGINGAGAGPGAAQRTLLASTAGAITPANAAFNCRTTFNVSFRGLNIQAVNAAFTGRMIDYGGFAPVPGDDAVYMRLDDCLVIVPVGGIGLSLYGATNGRFDQIVFGGLGKHVSLQSNGPLVGFCNNHLFSTCTFQPGVQFPVQGSGEGITFQSCCWQAGTDGAGRAFKSLESQPFKALSFIGCTFYDPSVGVDDWIVASWGNGFNAIGCRMSGFAGSNAINLGGIVAADPQEGGVRGVNISGNFFDNFNSAIFFNGTSAAKSNVRGGVIGGNSVTNGFLIANHDEVEQIVLLPNSIYDAPLELGAHMAFLGIPIYANNAAAVAAGLIAGQIYKTTGSESPLQIV